MEQSNEAGVDHRGSGSVEAPVVSDVADATKPNPE